MITGKELKEGRVDVEKKHCFIYFTVEEVKDDFRVGNVVGNDDATRAAVIKAGLGSAPLLAELEDVAYVLLGNVNSHPTDGLFDVR